MIKVALDNKAALSAFASLRMTEIPTAARNAVNDTARDVIKAEEREVGRVFDRPTPLIKRAFFLRIKATKDNHLAEVSTKDIAAIMRALSPHVYGWPAQRKTKPFERALSAGSFWVPSRTARLDAYGNIGRAAIRRIIREVELTGEQVSPSDAYAYLEMGGVEGIWDIKRLRRRQGPALVMLRVKRTPTYRKRLDVARVAQRESDRVFARHAQLAIEYAIRRRAG